MSNYTKSTNFATKDNLTPGDPLKVVRGTEIDTEFNNIATAVATKTDNSAAAITGGSITGITDLAVADGGTGASTAAGALNNLLPSQTSAANKYLQSDGTNASWDAVTLSTADITGTLPVANGGTGVTTSTGTTNVVLSNSPTLVTPALGTPSSAVLTNATGLPISTGVSGLGTGVATFLGTPSSANLASAVSDETGSGALVFANSPTLVTPALGTPSALVGTNITGTASGLTAGNVTTNANLTGAVTSVGNATSLGSFSSANLLGALTDETGTGSAVFATSPTLVTPILGTPISATLTNATGLPISTGVSGLGTGVATFLATPSSANLAAALTDETGSGANVFATSPTLVTPILGTPTSATLTNATGLPLTTGVTGTLPTANGGTNLTSFTSGGVVYASSSSALATGSALTFDGNGAFKSAGSTDGFISSTFVNTSAGTSAVNRIQIGNNTSDGAGQIVVYGGNHSTLASVMDINNANNADLRFLTNNTERVRLTSTSLYTASGINVGIGTSSPNIAGVASALTVNGTDAIIEVANSGTIRASLYGNASGAALSGVGSSGIRFFTSSSGATTLAATLDTSGNLGLSVTPSAWGGSFKAFQIASGGTSLWSDGSVAFYNRNTYYDGTNRKYVIDGYAQEYAQLNDGSHAWKITSSGSANGNISFTQAMTLDANGSLVTGGTTVVTNNGGITATTTSSGSVQATLAMRNAGTGNGSGTTLVFRGVSNTSAEHDYAYVSGVADDTTAKTGSIRFSTTAGSSPVERARITSGGYFKASNTGTYQSSTSTYHELRNDANANTVRISNTIASGYTDAVAQIAITGYSPNTTNSWFLFCGDSTATRAEIRSNGGIANYSANDVNLSDRREKTNFAPAGSYLDKICAIPVQTFNYIDQNLEEDGGLTLGVVAQDVQVVAPELVMESNWAKQGDEPKMRLSIYQTDLQYALMKCIQEQQAIIESLKARLDAANL